MPLKNKVKSKVPMTNAGRNKKSKAKMSKANKGSMMKYKKNPVVANPGPGI